jgi:hypothetical protein
MDVVPDDVGSFLESARAAGQVRAWGIAGERAAVAARAERLTRPPAVLQVRGDVISRVLEPLVRNHEQGLMLYGVVARALSIIRRHVTSDERILLRWNAALDSEVAAGDELPGLILREALSAEQDAGVLFSTIHPHRIHAAVGATNDTPDDSRRIQALRRLVATELASGRERA